MKPIEIRVLGVGQSVAEQRCIDVALEQRERIQHFIERASSDGRNPSELVIVILSMDDQYGAFLGNALMPGQNWDVFRERGEVPFARGLAVREGVAEYLDYLGATGASKIREAQLPVLIIESGMAVVLEAEAFK